MRFGNVLQRLGLAERVAAFAPGKIVDPVGGDAGEPRAQFLPLTQMAQIPPRRDKSFLRQILALAKTAGGAVGERTNERLVARDDLAESVTVASEGGVDQVCIVADGRWNHVG